MEQMILKGMDTPEGQEAAQLHNAIMASKMALANALTDFCRGLKMMRDGKQYRALGFETFEDYTKAAVGIKPRQAYNYIKAYEDLSPKVLEEHAGLGITKLNLLTQISDPEAREEVLAEADLEGMSAADLKALVAEKKKLTEQIDFLENAKYAAEKNEKAWERETELLREKLKAAKEQNTPAEPLTAQVVPEDDIESIREKARSEGAEAARAEAEAAAKREMNEKLKKAKADAEKKMEDAKAAAEREKADAVERAKAEAADEAKKAAEEAVAEKLAEEKEKNELAEQRAEELAKQLAVAASTETVAFGVYFEALQTDVAKMAEQVDKLRGNGKTETADKLNGALKALLSGILEGMK